MQPPTLTHDREQDWQGLNVAFAMKIVDVAEFYSPRGGGVKTYINRKMIAGAKYGHEIVVIAPGPHDGEEHRSGGRIIWVKSPRLPVDWRYRMFTSDQQVHRILDAEKPDILEGSSPWKGGQIVSRWGGATRKVMFWHQEPVSAYAQAFLGGSLGIARVDRLFAWQWSRLRKLQSAFDASVVSSNWLAQRIQKFGLAQPRVIPLGIEKDHFFGGRRDRTLRQQLLGKCGLGQDASLLLAVTRFHPEKHVGIVVRAFRLAKQSRDIGLVLVGDGPLRPWIRWRAKRAGSAHLAGVINDRDKLALYMASADALLHGGSAEPFGLVVAEAISCGLPVVVPDDGGAAELAQAEFGETYRAGDAKSASDAILRLLDRDRAIMERDCARLSSERIHSIDDHFQKLFDFYSADVRNHSSVSLADSFIRG